MRYSRFDYLRFILFILGQLVLVVIAFFVALISLGEFRIGAMFLAGFQLPLACIPPVRGTVASWKRKLWRGVVATLTLSAVGYITLTVLFEKYLIIGSGGSWLLLSLSVVSILAIWISAVTRIRFVIGHGVIAVVGMSIALVSLLYQVPFSFMDQSLHCEGETYRKVEYIGFKGDLSYAYFQTTAIPRVYSRPNWKNVGLECLEAGLKDDVLRERQLYRSSLDQHYTTVLTFRRPVTPHDVLMLHEEMDILFRQQDISVTVEIYPSPRNHSRGSIITIQNPPSERAFKELILANVDPDTYDPLDAPIIVSISLDATDRSFDEEYFLAFIDPRYSSDSDDFGELDSEYWRERLHRYVFRGVGSYDIREQVYREALFEYEAMWYEDFLKINQFLGSIFEMRYYNDYFYELGFAVDRPQEWRDMSISGGGVTEYSQEEFEQQYRFTVQRKADNDWDITLYPEELDIYKNHLHRYVVFLDKDSEIVQRFDYLFGQEGTVSTEQQSEWDQELDALGLSRERVQQGTREVIQSDYVEKRFR